MPISIVKGVYHDFRDLGPLKEERAGASVVENAVHGAEGLSGAGYSGEAAIRRETVMQTPGEEDGLANGGNAALGDDGNWPRRESGVTETFSGVAGWQPAAGWLTCLPTLAKRAIQRRLPTGAQDANLPHDLRWQTAPPVPGLPQCADAEGRKNRVGRNQREVFRQALRGQQTIERIFMTGGERQYAVGVIRGDRQNLLDA